MVRPSTFVLGDANVDVILPVDEYPAPGGDQRSERMVIEAGGSAANTAVVLARLGRRPALLACVGDDRWGELAADRLHAAGVSLEFVQRSPGEQTGLMFIPVTPDGQRTLFGRRGANRRLEARGLPAGDLQGAEALHLSGYAFLEGEQRRAAFEAVERVGEGEGRISLDTAFEPAFAAADSLRRALKQVDVLILGEVEAESLSGVSGEDSPDWFLDQGVELVALKLGRHGARIYGGGSAWEVPAIPVATVDTTGAGDAFSAGILHGVLSGLSPPAAAVLAAACGAAATTVWGAGAAFPQLSAVRAALEAAQGLTVSLQSAQKEALELLESAAS